jgi:TPP-dependent pyruvate/acetoin dehydrogenase alpha subunit
VRRARDPIEHVRTLLMEHSFADAKELKQMEREIKKARPRAHAASRPAALVLVCCKSAACLWMPTLFLV